MLICLLLASGLVRVWVGRDETRRVVGCIVVWYIVVCCGSILAYCTVLYSGI